MYYMPSYSKTIYLLIYIQIIALNFLFHWSLGVGQVRSRRVFSLYIKEYIKSVVQFL